MNFINQNNIMKITRGTFMNLSSLQTLYLAYNHVSHIEDFAFAGMHSLTTLVLHQNNIITIKSRTFMNLSRLQILTLSSNRISHIEDFAFAGMHSLTALYLHWNNLTIITRRMLMNLSSVNILTLWPRHVNYSLDMPKRAKEVISLLDLSRHEITVFTKQMLMEGISLKNLDLWSNLYAKDFASSWEQSESAVNNISHIDDYAFAGMQSLSELYMQGNNLTTIRRGMFLDLTSVKILNLGSSHISHIEDFVFSEMQSLSILDLSQNNLTAITRGMFMNLTNVKNVSLWSNHISHIEDFAFAGMQNLSTMSLWSNHISDFEDLAFAGMQNLSELDLDSNRITTITRGMFMNITSVKIIDLHRNLISNIEDSVFAGMQHLSKLDLRENANLQISEILCALNRTQSFLLKEYFMSAVECRCQLLDFQEQTISDCMKVSQANLPTVYWTTPYPCNALPDTDVLMINCEERGVKLKPKPEIEIANATFILLTAPNSDFIIYINLTSKTPEKIPLNASDIDYDPVDNRIYWISQNGSNIYSAFLNGTDKTVFGTSKNDARPRGIAVDPFSRLVFYSEENGGYIALITMSSLNHTTLVDSDLVKPGSIALDMWNGYMCWIDNGKRKIECANYDGSDRKELVKTGLHNPIGLVVDAIKNRIYWSDGNSLYQCNIGGGPVNLIVSTAKPFFRGLTRLGGRLYVINSDSGHDTTKSYVYQYELDGTKKKTVFEDSNLLYDIHIYSETLFYLNGPSSCEGGNHGCSHICIPTKNNKSKCLCPDELSLSMDEETCVTKEFSKMPITEVLVGTVIALLVVVAIFVLFIKRGHLHFVEIIQNLETRTRRGQDLEMRTTRGQDLETRTRGQDMEMRLIGLGAHEGPVSSSSNEYAEIHDRIIDVFEDMTTQPNENGDDHSIEFYNDINPSISLSAVDNTSSEAECALDEDDYAIPSETVSYLELEP